MDLTIINLDTPEKRAKGLQYMRSIPPATLWIFPDIAPGIQFHSRNVPEPFDIIFLDHGGNVIENIMTLEPPRAVVKTPEKTMYAIEAKEGELEKLGLDMGRKININALLGK